MLKRVFAAAALAAGATLVATPLASADPAGPFDPNAYHNWSSYFVAANDGSAFGANSSKPLLASPDGNTDNVFCLGDAKGIPLHDCVQQDALGSYHLTKVDNPLREFWMFNVASP